MVNEKEKPYEVSESIKSNIENFQLFTSHTDKWTQDIFEISDPYEFLLSKYILNIFYLQAFFLYFLFFYFTKIINQFKNM